MELYTQQKPYDCFSCCIASLLDISLQDVPDFFLNYKDEYSDWWDAVNNFLFKHGYGCFSVVGKDPAATLQMIAKHPGVVIVSGSTHRHKTFKHATLWQNGKMLWDPHPDKSGIMEIDAMDILYKIFTLTETASKEGE